jgi:hypothetical protein
MLDRIENNMLKWGGNVVRMEDNRWPKWTMTWLPAGRRRRGRPEVRWEKEVKRFMKQSNLTSDDAVNRQLWRLKTRNRLTTGKRTYTNNVDWLYLLWAKWHWDRFSLEYFGLLPSVPFYQCSTLNFTLPHLSSARQVGETSRTFKQSNALSDIVTHRTINTFSSWISEFKLTKSVILQYKQRTDIMKRKMGQQKFLAFSGRRRFITVIHTTHTARFLIFSISTNQFTQHNTLNTNHEIQFKVCISSYMFRDRSAIFRETQGTQVQHANSGTDRPHLLTDVLTYLLTYLLHEAESFLRS